jgi:inhibitor of cysteine peptidase
MKENSTKLIGAGIILILLLSAMPHAQNQDTVKKFSSYEELQAFLVKENNYNNDYGLRSLFGGNTFLRSEFSVAVTDAADKTDFSGTNIQVQGVDEADIVKTDGEYIYSISGSNIIITKAFPAENAEVVSKITFSEPPEEFFIHGDKLIVFGTEYRRHFNKPSEIAETSVSDIVVPAEPYTQKTFIEIYDITDKETPELIKEMILDGTYYDSRMIDGYVYGLVNVQAMIGKDVPIFKPEQEEFPDISYFDVPANYYMYTNIVSINIENIEEVNNKAYLLGNTATVFVSQKNIYIVNQKSAPVYSVLSTLEEVLIPSLPTDIQGELTGVLVSDLTVEEKIVETEKLLTDWVKTLTEEERKRIDEKIFDNARELEQERIEARDKSIVHKISIKDGEIEYDTYGEVRGEPLNQFSMDEHSGLFRIATTTNVGIDGRWVTMNNLYVLDESMNVIGDIEGVAPGERIFSVRFMGDKAYMVTFRQMDPFFVIDLSVPEDPIITGELKLPGVSDYLHPYDDTHIIGIGRDATETGRTTGVKISIFDVTDIKNPIETANYVIPGVHSEASREHKAVLFDKERNLLVVPISQYGRGSSLEGAYVFDISEDLIDLREKIQHDSRAVRRSLYIENVLYTISERMIKANHLTTMEELKIINLR